MWVCCGGGGSSSSSGSGSGGAWLGGGGGGGSRVLVGIIGVGVVSAVAEGVLQIVRHKVGALEQQVDLPGCATLKRIRRRHEGRILRRAPVQLWRHAPSQLAHRRLDLLVQLGEPRRWVQGPLWRRLAVALVVFGLVVGFGVRVGQRGDLLFVVGEHDPVFAEVGHEFGGQRDCACFGGDGAVDGVPGGEGAVHDVGFANGGEDVEEGLGGLEGVCGCGMDHCVWVDW